MFNSTHTLVGFALARAGLDRWTPHATWTVVIASNLPDIDIVAQFAGTTTYLEYHRGITHTFIGTLILSLTLAILMHAIVLKGRWLGWKTLWKIFLTALIAMSTHPVLDWANNYGIRPFLPFSHKWYYGDTLFIIDPYLDLILFFGLVISYNAGKRRKAIAAATLMVALIYVVGMRELRSVAQQQFARYTGGMAAVIESAVTPQFLSPFQWTGFVETPADVSNFTINALTGDIRGQTRMLKTPESAVTEAAQTSHAASVFRGFARFPVARVEQTPLGYRVLLIDFRFFRSPPQTALSAEILLDSNLHVIGESMSFVRPID